MTRWSIGNNTFTVGLMATIATHSLWVGWLQNSLSFVERAWSKRNTIQINSNAVYRIELFNLRQIVLLRFLAAKDLPRLWIAETDLQKIFVERYSHYLVSAWSVSVRVGDEGWCNECNGHWYRCSIISWLITKTVVLIVGVTNKSA